MRILEGKRADDHNFRRPRKHVNCTIKRDQFFGRGHVQVSGPYNLVHA